MTVGQTVSEFFSEFLSSTASKMTTSNVYFSLLGMANFVLKLYDKDLKEIKTTEVEVTKFSEMASSAFTGKYFMFIFSAASFSDFVQCSDGSFCFPVTL